jgi:hypothetical protein
MISGPSTAVQPVTATLLNHWSVDPLTTERTIGIVQPGLRTNGVQSHRKCKHPPGALPRLGFHPRSDPESW